MTSKKGVLLVNLGSPDSPRTSDVRRYLREFLMDKRVLDAPWPIRFGIVHFAILPFRPRKSAEAYHKIWTPEGSPLVVITDQIRRSLAKRLPIPVEVAMRYQNPSIPSAIDKLLQDEVNDLFLIPLFPHYAMSSYETAVERVQEVLRIKAPQAHLSVQAPYFDHPAYIRALVASAQEYLRQDFDHLLFSFHGIPERHLRKTDPTHSHCLSGADCCAQPSPAHAKCYRAQCLRTVREFARFARLPSAKFSVAFQSRLGRDPWLQPYTDKEIERLARQGVKSLLVICPAFVSDCLETLEEIGMRGRETFEAAGGASFAQIPCLNAHPVWIEALNGMVQRFLSEAALAV